MFRKPSRKKDARRRRKSSSDDDDDDEPEEDRITIIRKQPKKSEQKSRVRTVVRTNEVPVLVANNEDEMEERQRKRVRLGRDDGLTKTTTTPSNSKPRVSMYGKEALEQLKAEQKFQPTRDYDEVPQQDEQEQQQSPTTTTILHSTEDDVNGFVSLDGPSEQYIPVSHVQPLAQQQQQDLSTTVMVEDGNSAMLQFASLAEMRQQIEQALYHLRQDDTQETLSRRHHQTTQIEQELERYKRDLHISGQAHEYFQNLRYRLASWVGALRELNAQVGPLQDALYSVEADVSAVVRWKEWQDDMATVLHEHGLLACVLGRQPDSSAMDSSAGQQVVDEFGRNVLSQYVMQREKRYQRRRRICEQRQEPPRGDESDAFLSDNEQEQLRERHGELQRSLAQAVENLDEEYTKLQNLVDDFEKWHDAYPEEYKQCFTSLSLADLASVLIRVELCSLNDPWNESKGYNEGKWTAVVEAARRSGVLDDAGLDRLVEKTVFPAVSTLLDKSGVNLSSKRQMEAVGNFVGHVKHFFRADSNVLERLMSKLVSYVERAFAETAIPIPNSTATMEPENPLLRETMHYAVVGQMHRCQKVLVNVLTYWAPFLQDRHEFAATVLEFTGTKFVYLLSSLKPFDQPPFSATPSDSFTVVWNVLVQTGWLDRPELMLHAAPVRAAASVYGVTQ